MKRTRHIMITEPHKVWAVYLTGSHFTASALEGAPKYLCICPQI